jgi:uncharacterized membrane protein
MRRFGWAVMAVLAVLIGVYALGAVAVPAIGAPFLKDRFRTIPLAAYTHLAAAGIALLVGPFQHNARLRGRFLNAHRWLGRTYVVAVMLGGTAGLVLATMSEGGMAAHLGFGLLAVLWLLTTGTAYVRIRAKDQGAHRRWMTRSFALTYAAVMLRIYLPLSLALGIPFETAYPIISWIAWVPNLIVAEWLIMRKRPAVASIEPRSAAAA